MKTFLHFMLLILFGLLLSVPQQASSQSNGTTTIITVTYTSATDGHNPGISGDGRFVAFASDSGLLTANDTNQADDIFVYDHVTAQITRITPDTFGNDPITALFSTISLSYDGRYVVYDSDGYNLVPNDNNGVEDIFLHDRQTATTTRISVDSNGVEGDGASKYPYISRDGRYVIFSSLATNLVPNDTNGLEDVFLHDRQTGTTTRVSVDSNGNQATTTSFDYASANDISDDGRYILFSHIGDNLVPNDTNNAVDVFVHDRQTETTTRVSVDNNGLEANDHSQGYRFAADNRYVVLSSNATNLVATDANSQQSDIFVYDRQTETMTLVSTDSNGVQGNDYSFNANFSADGQYVVFESTSTNLIANDTNNKTDVFRKDLQTGVTTRVSVNTNGVEGNWDSFVNRRGLSDDGTRIAFPSNAKNWLPNDNSIWYNIFLRDVVTNITTHVSASQQSQYIQTDDTTSSFDMSRDGRYIAFISRSNKLVSNDFNTTPDVFVHDRQTGITELVSISNTGQQQVANYYSPSISDDGRYVAFVTDAQRLVPEDINFQLDAYVYDRQTDQIRRISVNPANLGQVYYTTYYSVVLSGDGRYAVFPSDNSGLVPTNLNGKRHTFLYDMQAQTYTLVSINSDGVPANNNASGSVISYDGRFILFSSNATNLVPNDTNGWMDLFLHDRQTGETVRVNVSSSGEQAEWDGQLGGSVSDDGRYVAFSVRADNLVPYDTNNLSDVFLHDLQTKRTRRISVNPLGNQSNGSSGYPVISANGQYVAFLSGSSDLVAGDTNNKDDVFVYNILTDKITRVSVDSNGNQANNGASYFGSISQTGEYVSFLSSSTNLVPNDVNNQPDIFVHQLILPTILPAPTLVEPVHTLSQVVSASPMTFSWDAVSGATGYRVQIALDDEFMTVVHDQIVASNTHTHLLEDANTYYWRVRAVNDGVWSTVYQFTLTPSIATPTLIAPADMTITTAHLMTFTWNSVNGVSDYQIQISTKSDFTDIINDQTVVSPTHSFEFTSFGTYYWRVRANYSAWSDVRQLTIQPLLPPTLIAPIHNSSVDILTVDYSWDAVAGATAYEIQTSPYTSFSTTLYSEVVTNLTYSYTYPTSGVQNWRVRAISGTLLGEWSEVRQVHIVPVTPTPTLLEPQTGMTTNSFFIPLSWTPVIIVMYYEIELAPEPTFGHATGYIRKTSTIPSITIDMPFGGLYYWRVRAFIAGSGFSEWSEVRSFQILPIPVPTLQQPAQNSTVFGLSANFTWQTVPDMPSYVIQIATNSNFTALVHTNHVEGTNQFTYTLPIHNTYYWRVAGASYSPENSTLHQGAWSTPYTFTTSSLPPAPNLLLPLDNVTLSDATTQFTWQTVNDATGYRIQIASDDTFTTIFDDQTVLTNSHAYSIATNGDYVWRVQTLTLNHVSDWSVTRHLTIYRTYIDPQSLGEQELFKGVQSYLADDMAFVLFDVTPTGILTTLQFDDGAVVTANIQMSLQNGLITITMSNLVGGTPDQQNAMYEHMPSLIMNTLDDLLPDDYIAIQTVTLTDSAINFSIMRPNVP